MLGGKVKCFAIKGIHKQNKATVYVELSGDVIILIPIERDVEIRKIALFRKIPSETIEVAKESFEDYDFTVIIVDYEFKISEMNFVNSCVGCLYENKSAYSCFGCEENIGDISFKSNYVKKEG